VLRSATEFDTAVSIGVVKAEYMCLSSTSGSILASGVDGDTTAVFSDVFALDDPPDVMRFWFWLPYQPCSTIMAEMSLTNCLKLSGAWMTDGGASSESALRTVVLSL
jgi:hypothetical protein